MVAEMIREETEVSHVQNPVVLEQEAVSLSQNETGKRLLDFIQKIERLEEEKQALAEDIKEVFKVAKSDGFDVKIMRQILKIRKMDEADRAEQEALLETYMAAIGM